MRPLAIDIAIETARLNTDEKRVLRYLCTPRAELESFHELLVAAAFKADPDNLARIAQGFPGIAAAVTAWRYGDLSARARALELDV